MAQECKNKCTIKCGMKHYLTKLGPVIFGSKPIHLFSFKEHPYDLIHALNRCQKVKYRLIESVKDIKVLIYNEKNCSELLEDKRRIRFLKSQGYNMTLDMYLDFFESSLKANEIPHIIGIFFGYPVKDVIGFMGDKRLKKTKVQGWCVFGDPRLSDRIFSSFLLAEQRMVSLLNEMHERDLFQLI